MYKDLDLSRINGRKRAQVSACVDIVSKYGFVKRLIIFGSSVTDACTDKSDVDICLDIEGSTRDVRMYYLDSELSRACNRCCDILTYGKINGKIKEEVENKGVVVYEL